MLVSLVEKLRLGCRGSWRLPPSPALPVSPRSRPPSPRRPLFPKNRHVWGGRGEGGGKARAHAEKASTRPALSPPPPLSSPSLTRMILPQVRLRKPCYDFSFL